MKWIIGGLYQILAENALENKGKLSLEMNNIVWRRLRRAKRENKAKTRLKKVVLGRKCWKGYMVVFGKIRVIWLLGYMHVSKPI